MKIYLGSDHQGFFLKEKVFAYLAKRGYDVEDVGGKVLDPNDDFPDLNKAIWWFILTVIAGLGLAGTFIYLIFSQLLV